MDSKETRERMESGRLYCPGDKELLEEQFDCLELLHEYNAARPREQEKKAELLKKMFAQIGENCYIETPFYANFGGRHVHMGKNVYANFNLTLVDDGHIYIGDYCMLGPSVTVATAGHPVEPDLRREKGLQFNLDVHIGSNVWIGANSVLVPGVSIGDNTVIGAGSIVTKDIPANVVAVGNPCKVLREISEHDKKYYYKDRVID